MKRYKKYKDSGIPWIREIPEHWEMKKLKHFAECTLGKMLTNEDKGGYCLKPYLRAQNIRWFTVDISDVKEMWFSQDEIQKLELSKNDLLVSEGGEVGRTCIWNKEIEECYIQNSVHRIRLKKYNPKYYLYHFFLSGNKGYFDSIVNKISIAHLTGEKLKDLLFLIPPKEEQTLIANHLDRKTFLIDDLIAKKKRLIELLNEEKTAVINQAVTKGLDPNSPMKDSQIPWIGKIPKHWEILKYKRIFGVSSGDFLQKEYEDIEGYPVYGGNGLRGYSKKFNNEGKMLLIGRVGAKCGNVHLVEDKYWVSEHALRVLPKIKFIEEYFKYLLELTNLNKFAITTAQPLLNSEIVLDRYTIFPSIIEQNKIAGYLDRKTAQIEESKNRINKEIELLNQYRAALISEVVTGKIDVRNVS
jgi:type I restriction enzyme S subunit